MALAHGVVMWREAGLREAALPAREQGSAPVPSHAGPNSRTTRAASAEGRTGAVCANPECGKTFEPKRENQIACDRACYRKTPSWRALQQRQDARPERREQQTERRRIEDALDEQRRELLREYNLRYNLASKYGITVDQYMAMLESQQRPVRRLWPAPARGRHQGGEPPARRSRSRDRQGPCAALQQLQ